MTQTVWGPFPATVLPSVRHNDRDGDTFVALIDHGRDIFSRSAIRILGINARELHQPGGEEARAHLIELMPEGTQITVTSVAYDKFGGRLDCAVSVPGIGDLATRLISDGYAAPWGGSGPKPIPPWPIPSKG